MSKFQSETYFSQYKKSGRAAETPLSRIVYGLCKVFLLLSAAALLLQTELESRLYIIGSRIALIQCRST